MRNCSYSPFIRRCAPQLAAAIAIAWLASEQSSAAADFYLRDGDVVVFYGDSITEQGHYTRAVEEYVLARRPDLKVSFHNRGWSGDRAWGGEGGSFEERLARDVIPLRPSVVTIMLGMNDGYYVAFDADAVAAFRKSLTAAVDTLTRELPGVRITLIGTSPYDDVSPGDRPNWEQGIPGGYNSVVERFSQVSREVAQAKGLEFVDMNAPLVELLRAANDRDAKLAAKLIPDRIHPGPVAGQVMAARLLDAWNAPRQPSIVQLDRGISASIEAKLPVPVLSVGQDDSLRKLVWELLPKLCELFGVRLQLEGGPRGPSSISIDDGEIGTFAAEQLKNGIELATVETPLDERAKALAELTQLRSDVQFALWRRLVVPADDRNGKTLQHAADELGDLDERIVKLQRSAALPQPHRIQLTPAEP